MTFVLDETHDPARQSWIASANGHADFPVQNLPFGRFSPPGQEPRAGVAIGASILDLRAAAAVDLLPRAAIAAASTTSPNALIALAPSERMALRRRLSQLLSDEAYRHAVEPLLHEAASCAMHLPAVIGDYTDFYAGIHHAQNVGRLFRPDNPLLPNYKHVPIGYHGRASSIRPSGDAMVRPKGQLKPPESAGPVFGPTQRLDYELELGVWIGAGNRLGEPIGIQDAADHIAGYCLLNDWSARDFQVWEYQPLGPFLAKNFHTTLSPWVVTPEALAPFRLPQTPRAQDDPQPLPYLWDELDQAHGALAIELEVAILTPAMRQSGLAPHRLSRGPAANLYWTFAQMVAHHACGGCNLNPGDLLGTGTISGPAPGSYGSLLEITQGGKTPIVLPNGEQRTFLEDGDEVLLRGSAQTPGRISIGFGECRAVIRPAP